MFEERLYAQAQKEHMHDVRACHVLARDAMPYGATPVITRTKVVCGGRKVKKYVLSEKMQQEQETAGYISELEQKILDLSQPVTPTHIIPLTVGGQPVYAMPLAHYKPILAVIPIEDVDYEGNQLLGDDMVYNRPAIELQDDSEV